MKTRNEFIQITKELGLNNWWAEIGVAEGNFSEWNSSGDYSQYFLVDSWEYKPDGDPSSKLNPIEMKTRYQGVLKRFENNPKITVLKMTSDEASITFKDEVFDWIYIDASHHYIDVKQDIGLWYPKVRKGGILSGHDYINDNGPAVFGVKQAVDEFITDKKLTLNLTDETNTYYGRDLKSWWIIK